MLCWPTAQLQVRLHKFQVLKQKQEQNVSKHCETQRRRRISIRGRPGGVPICMPSMRRRPWDITMAAKYPYNSLHKITGSIRLMI